MNTVYKIRLSPVHCKARVACHLHVIKKFFIVLNELALQMIGSDRRCTNHSLTKLGVYGGSPYILEASKLIGTYNIKFL